MRNLGRFALTMGALALFAGCGVSPQPPKGVSGAIPYLGAIDSGPTASGRSYSVLYSFQGIPDAEFPGSGLTMVNGTFYGTAAGGGCYYQQCGTVFKITPSGTEQVIYAFKGGNDGESPVGNLVNVNGVLYGVTLRGGHKTGGSPYGCGTVFKVSTSGQEHVLYRFKGGRDADYVLAGLTSLNGDLYGTSDHGGGYYGLGTVFEVTLSGHEKVLYRFKGGASDGEAPDAPLIAFHGKLYGTTSYGGCNQCDGGRGTIFSITPGGTEHMLYAFQGADYGGDGATPEAGLLAVNDVLYGTTLSGGYNKTRECGRSSGHGLGGCGTVFSVTPDGKEQILHRFKGKTDGSGPAAALTVIKGKLFGTTIRGGSDANYGTVFQLTLGGKEGVLYRFKGAPDGSEPFDSLTAFKGVLYGTTIDGGSSCAGFSPPGCGTVFELSP